MARWRSAAGYPCCSRSTIVPPTAFAPAAFSDTRGATGGARLCHCWPLPAPGGAVWVRVADAAGRSARPGAEPQHARNARSVSCSGSLVASMAARKAFRARLLTATVVGIPCFSASELVMRSTTGTRRSNGIHRGAWQLRAGFERQSTLPMDAQQLFQRVSAGVLTAWRRCVSSASEFTSVLCLREAQGVAQSYNAAPVAVPFVFQKQLPGGCCSRSFSAASPWRQAARHIGVNPHALWDFSISCRVWRSSAGWSWR